MTEMLAGVPVAGEAALKKKLDSWPRDELRPTAFVDDQTLGGSDGEHPRDHI